MGGAKIGSRFERLQDVVLGFVFLAGVKVGLRQVECRRSFVKRVQRKHSGIFTDRALIVLLGKPQFAEALVKLLIFGIDIVDAV